jgi:flagellar M-ring protein FliF
VLFILLVVRPLLMRMVESSGSDHPGLLAGPAPAGTRALPAPADAPPGLMVPAAGTDQQMIDLGQVEGRVAASSIRKIGEIVEKHPEEAVSIVRSWMYQGS